jgi:CMP/dCMP kinase
MAIITIRGKLGSGAPETGKLVAEKLRIDYIDREIIAKVAARLNIDEDDIMEKESPPAGLQSRIAEALSRGFTVGDGVQGIYLPMWQMPLDNNRYVEALSSFLTELSQGRSVVIFGRGGQYILKKHPQSLHISIIAPLNLRIQRVMKMFKLSETAAKQQINRDDSSAREFGKRYFNTEMDDPNQYDLTINTERLSFEESASLVVQALDLKKYLTVAD